MVVNVVTLDGQVVWWYLLHAYLVLAGASPRSEQ